MRCQECDHIRNVHIATTGEPMHCRITGCPCEAFVSAAPLPEQASTEPRRICIDVPDGYTLFAQFVPHDGKIEVITTFGESVSVGGSVSVETDAPQEAT